MKIYKNISKNISIFSLAILAFMLFSSTALAHRSPATCSGSGLGINLYSDVVEVHIGEVITYSLDIYNGTGPSPIACDASEIVASITTPDGAIHPISLRRTALVNADLDLYPNVVRYTALTANVASGILAATANVTGTIHQNDTNSQGGGFQGLNVTILADVVTPTPTPTQTPLVTVIPPVVPPVIVPPPTGGGGGGVYVPIPEPIIATTSTVTTVIVPIQVPLFPNAGFAPQSNHPIINILSFFFGFSQMVVF